MLITIVLFDRFTALDLAGPHDALGRLPGAGVVLAAPAPGPVANEKGPRLKGPRAPTHWLARDQLTRFGAVPGAARVVTHAKYMTAAGVSAGLGWGFTLAGGLAGDAIAPSVQLAPEYDPQPPHQAASPGTAPRAVADALRARHCSTLTGTRR
jgi:transcriptional regulator GlxA family with amidase domain